VGDGEPEHVGVELQAAVTVRDGEQRLHLAQEFGDAVHLDLGG